MATQLSSTIWRWCCTRNEAHRANCSRASGCHVPGLRFSIFPSRNASWLCGSPVVSSKRILRS
eukprot:3572799-Amphidinium_carterae.1